MITELMKKAYDDLYLAAQEAEISFRAQYKRYNEINEAWTNKSFKGVAAFREQMRSPVAGYVGVPVLKFATAEAFSTIYDSKIKIDELTDAISRFAYLRQAYRQAATKGLALVPEALRNEQK